MTIHSLFKKKLKNFHKMSSKGKTLYPSHPIEKINHGLKNKSHTDSEKHSSLIKHRAQRGTLCLSKRNRATSSIASDHGELASGLNANSTKLSL